MSLPVVLPGSCCPVSGAAQLADASYRPPRARGLSAASRAGAGGSRRRLLPGRPLLSLGLLQLLLGGAMVALSFGALSLSSSGSIRSACPFWPGSAVILSGIVGLTTWRRPMLLLVNVFVLLSLVCVLLNLAGFILCCQGAQLVSSMTSCQMDDVGGWCYCCAVSPASKCPEGKLLELHPAHSCNTMRILLKKVLFALCALNALSTAVCLMAAALRYLQIFNTRTSCMDEPRATVEEGEESAQNPDPEEFVAPAPPPSYFSTFYSYTPRLARRMLGDSVIPVPHIYGSRIKGVEVFCPLGPPPPYEAVAATSASAAHEDIEVTLTEVRVDPTTAPEAADSTEEASPNTASGGAGLQVKPPTPTLTPRRKRRLQRSSSDPVLIDLTAKVRSSNAPIGPLPQTTDSSTQTSQPTLAAQSQVTLRRGNKDGRTPRRPRPSSMVDYQSYRHTQQLVQRILEQPAAQGLAPEVQELMDSIRHVLQSDQEHMEEAVRCASYIEQAFTESQLGPGQPAAPQQPPPPQQEQQSWQTFPRPPRRRPGLLHLRSCGDLSSFTCAALDSAEHRGQGSRQGSMGRSRPGSRAASRAGSRQDHPERPHSLIGVFRETVL